MAKQSRHPIAHQPSRITLFYLGIAALFGVIFAILIPPFQAPDEPHHLYRVQHIQSGHLYGQYPSESNNRLGGVISSHYPELAERFRYLRYDYNARIDKSEIISALHSEDSSKFDFVDFPNVAYYPFISYIYPALITKLLHIFQPNGLVELYLLRISSILLWIVIIASCVKLCPRLKWLWLLLGTLPSALFTHSGLSTDIMTHSLVWIFMALILNSTITKSYSSQKILLTIIILAVIVYSRPVFAPLYILYFLIPDHRFARLQKLLLGLFILSIVAFQFIHLGEQFIPYDQYHPEFREDVQLNPGVHPSHQFNHMLHHPVSFSSTLVRSWFESFPSTWSHYLGKFGWEHNYIPIIFLIFLTLALFILINHLNIGFTPKERIIVLTTALLLILATSVSLYMQWEPVGGKFIHSLSGRYFVGIFPFFFIGLSGWNLRLKEIPVSFLTIIWIGSWISALIAILNRYYI